MDITCTKREDTDLGPILITIEGHRRDDLIMAKMYVLKMLRHTTGGRPSTDWEIWEVHMRYPLSHHDNALLGIGREFWEPINIDIPTDEKNLHTGSNVDSYSEEEIDLTMTGGGADGNESMED